MNRCKTRPLDCSSSTKRELKINRGVRKSMVTRINAIKSAKNIGVWLDSVLSMDVQINNICKTAFFHLLNIAKIRKFLTHRQCEILIHAFISSKLDYCNVLLSGLKQSQINRVQHVQNSAARLLTATSRYELVTPVLRSLHWLPVSARIDFKILLLVFKV